MIYKLEETECAEQLFCGWNETLIWSCTQKVMGEIYADDREKPESAVAVLGDFRFLGGVPKKEVALYEPEGVSRKFQIIVPRNQAWEKLVEEVFGDKAVRITRYATKKEPGIFDTEKLETVVESLKAGDSLRMIDEALYHRCREQKWSRDLVSQYESYEKYRELGIGAVVLRDGVLAAGASSYSSYRGGIEIEIDTKEEYRRQGLAYACGAKLILECIGRGLYPSWDAHNLRSLALAEKLGYHFDNEYVAYEAVD